MSITDELRKALGRIRIMAEEQDGCSMLYYISPTVDELTAIADRIDREHRTAMEKVAAEADTLPMTDESMAEHGWVRLPVDADGVPIHVGDVMEWVTYDDTYESVIRIVDGVGADVFFAWSNDRAGHAQYEAQAYRHHHAPTVEDVLREFAREIDADAYGITDAKVAEFAAKLRLAEGVDQ